MRRCPRCGIEKPLASFARNRSAKSGLSTYCKPCFLDGWVREPCPDCGKPKSKASARCRSCARSCNSGAANGQWKGGRIVRPDGYVDVWTPTRYVKEHRLVMEAKLGRLLLPDENVHHINGVRDDNRPENLELWIVKQPKGQRVEDAVAWAHEILDRYETVTGITITGTAT